MTRSQEFATLFSINSQGFAPETLKQRVSLGSFAKMQLRSLDLIDRLQDAPPYCVAIQIALLKHGIRSCVGFIGHIA